MVRRFEKSLMNLSVTKSYKTSLFLSNGSRFLSCSPHRTARTQGVTPESARQEDPTSSKDVKKSPTGKEES